MKDALIASHRPATLSRFFPTYWFLLIAFATAAYRFAVYVGIIDPCFPLVNSFFEKNSKEPKDFHVRLPQDAGKFALISAKDFIFLSVCDIIHS